MSRSTTPSSGSISPEVFFDAPDTPLLNTLIPDALDVPNTLPLNTVNSNSFNTDEFHECLEDTQDSRVDEGNINGDKAKVKDDIAVTDAHTSYGVKSSVYPWKNGDNNTVAEHMEETVNGDSDGNMCCESVQKLDFLAEYKHNVNALKIDNDLKNKNISSNYSAHDALLNENRKVVINVGKQCDAICESRLIEVGNVESTQNVSSNQTRTCGCSWENSTSSAAEECHNTHYGGDVSETGSEAASQLQVVSISLAPDTGHTTSDDHFSIKPTKSVVPVSLPRYPKARSSWCTAQTQLSNIATAQSSALCFLDHRDTQLINEYHSSVVGHSQTPVAEYSENFQLSHGFRSVCRNEADETTASRLYLFPEFVPVQKIPGSNLREETRKIVMMLDNDKACKIPRPSLGLQDRVRNLVQQSVKKHATYIKGPRFCSTVVKSIVKQSQARLQGRRDSFQDFIQRRKEQATQRLFAKPLPCYGSIATSSYTTSGPKNDGASDIKSVSCTDDPGAVYYNKRDIDTSTSAGKASITTFVGDEMTAQINKKSLCKHILQDNEGVKSQSLVSNEVPINYYGTNITSLDKAVEPQTEKLRSNNPDVLQRNTNIFRDSSLLLETKNQAFNSSVPAAPTIQVNIANPISENIFGIIHPTNASQTEKYNNVDIKCQRDYRGNKEADANVSGGNSKVELQNNAVTPYTMFDYRNRPMESSSSTNHPTLNRNADEMLDESIHSLRVATKSYNTAHLQAHVASLSKASLTSRNQFPKVQKDENNCQNPYVWGEARKVSYPSHLPTPVSLQGQCYLARAPNMVKKSQNASSLSLQEQKQFAETDKLSVDYTRESIDTNESSKLTRKKVYMGETSLVKEESLRTLQPWTFIDDITKLKTGNLLARCGGIRSQMHPISSASKHPQSPVSTTGRQRTLATIQNKKEKLFNDKSDIIIDKHFIPSKNEKGNTDEHLPLPDNEYNTDGHSFLNNVQNCINEHPPHSQKGQGSVDKHPLFPNRKISSEARTLFPSNSRQNSIEDQSSLSSNNQQNSSDEHPSLPSNNRQGSIDECGPLNNEDSINEHLYSQQKSRQSNTKNLTIVSKNCHKKSIDDRDFSQENDPNTGQNVTNDLAIFQQDTCRSRTNSSQRGSRQSGINCNRNKSININSGSTRDSNNARNFCGSRSGSRVSFGQDLLRKCLEVAVEKYSNYEWEENQIEQTGAVEKQLSNEELNKSLSNAVCSHDAEKARSLLEIGADANVSCGHLPALLRAANDGALYVVQALLAAGADIDARCDQGNSALHVAARGGHSEVALQLVHSGAFVDAINRSSVTPLQMALAHGHLEVARTLLRLNADIFLPNKIGETSYEMMKHLGYLGLCECPREVRRDSAPGTRVEQPSMEIPVTVKMILGVENGCPVTVETCLTEGAPPNAVVPLALHWPAQATVLHRAAHHGHDLIVRLLLAAGAEVNRQDVVGNTPLHAAAQAGHNRVVKILLKHGALQEATSRSGMTPLHRAASKGKELTCNLLVRRGSSLQAQDTAGRTPADWARKRGFKLLARKLLYRRKSSGTLLGDCERHYYMNHLKQLHEAALKEAQHTNIVDCQE